MTCILRNYSRQLAAEELEQELQTLTGEKTTVRSGIKNEVS